MLDNKEDFPEFTFHEINGMRLTCPEQVGSFSHLGTRNFTGDPWLFCCHEELARIWFSWGVYFFLSKTSYFFIFKNFQAVS
jgi:hypothetical protein